MRQGAHPARNSKAARFRQGGIDRIEIASGDARVMPLADNSFDAVASSLVIHSISGDGDRRRAIREVYRHL
ncbi:class I SAM-dependent methyltransferase [Alicyclobacillus acidoterrestris]|uniref:class I SAM-dependent methyltransferase n=1 Tax=Alicyclobacillus acidoterrestris TaxID=1450 RepID=UPI003F536E20